MPISQIHVLQTERTILAFVNEKIMADAEIMKMWNKQ